MSEAIGRPGQAALPRPLGIGEILGTAFRLYQRHWRTLLAIAAVVVVPLTLLQYLFGDWLRSRGEVTSYQQISTATWAVGAAWLVAGLAGILMYLVLTGAITRAVAAEVAGEDPSLEQSYRFGFHRLGSVLLVSVLVGLATVAGLILFIIPGIWIGVRLAVSVEALVVEGRRGTQAMGRSWELVGGHWWHAFGALVVAGLLTGVVNAVITTPFNNTGWLVQAIAAAIATVITMPYSVLVGVLLYLDLRARKEQLTLERISTNPRYALLCGRMRAARHGPFAVRVIDGCEPVAFATDSVAAEAATTSLQLHLRVPPERFAAYYNGAQMIAGAQVAVAANSPYLLARQAWQETRITLLEQLLDTRRPGEVRAGSKSTAGNTRTSMCSRKL